MRAWIPEALKHRLLGGLRRLDPDREIVAAEFDAAWYLRAYPDIAEARVEPLAHFLAFGWKEGRDPNPRFSIREYLNEYPDVAKAGVNPFVHFLKSGAAESRAPRPDLGFRYDIIARLTPVEERVAQAMRARVATQGRAVLDAALARSRGGLRDLHVTFSHDDYSANLGGVQAGLQREAARLAELGRDHLHIHPAAPWPVVREAGEPAPLGVVWNGVAVGAFPGETVIAALKAAAAGPSAGRSFAIHSLLGHAADETADILAAAGLSEGSFWLHDFASLCAGYHLLRDDVEDCAAPPPDSAACGICAYGPWRGRHLAEHERLFRRLKLTVVSPSQATLDLWQGAWDFPAAGAVVHPHARLKPRGPAPEAPADRPFRLAYAGLPVPHKGWPVFRDLVQKHAEDSRYEFLHLGARSVPDLPVRFVEAAARPGDPLAMQRALEAAEADAVLVWPLCRETFSFIAYEAVAAGCALLTGPDSGNVAAFVREGGHGLVLDDETALAQAFESGDITALSRARRRPMLHDLEFSALTVDLLRETRPA